MTKKFRRAALLFMVLPFPLLLGFFAGPARAEIPAGWPWKITHLIYPTLGCPEIVKDGETFRLEFDFTGKGEGPVQPAVTDWEAKLFSSNDRWPTEVECVVVEAVTDGLSERWPAWSPSTDYWKGSGPWAGREVWKVTVRVPAGTRTDLYDLRVTATGGSEVSDSQPHAVQVVDEYKDNYNFIQITDFHINDPRGPESWIALPEPHPNSEEFTDYRYNLKAIDSLNLINPDFIIMSGDTVFGIPFFVEYPWESTGITDLAGTAPDWNGEYNQAYEHLLRLNVPIVCLPGNHDTYNLEAYNILVGDWTGLEGHVKQDGAEIWPTVFSPRYFGWNYGDKCHFTCIWSYDKPATEFNPLVNNTRNFLSGAWLFPEAEVPQDLEAGGQVRGDQMNWIGRDLADAQGNYDLLVIASHHPFFGDYSGGDSFTSQTNREELAALSRQTGVRLAISGHTHVDNFFVDTGGPEEIIHLNTTSTTFNTKEYPGFRRVFIEGGIPVSYYYQFNSQTTCFSYPTYRETILEKHDDPVAAFNDLTSLDTPSIGGWFSNTDPNNAHKEFTCWNYLTAGDPAVVLDNTVVDFVMPDFGDETVYQITNGTLLQFWNPTPGYLTLQVRADPVPPGNDLTVTVSAVPPEPEHLVLQSGDYDGDGRSDLAVFRPAPLHGGISAGMWAVRGLGTTYFGAAGDVPVSGDYDGDGYADVSIFRPSNGFWAVKDVTRVYYGASGDTAVPADYDGDGTCEIAVFRGSNGLWAIRGLTNVYFGTAADLPAPSDYSGDGCADLAVFRRTTGLWAVRDVTRCYFGTSGDRPVPGVYNWYGTDLSAGIDNYWSPFKSRPAVFRPSNGLWAVRGGTRFYFGNGGDFPVPARFSGGLLDDPAIFRETAGMWAIRDVTRAYYGAVGDLPVTR